MKPIRLFPSTARRAGFALVVTLAAVVFVTVLLLAFFTRAQLNRQISFSSTNQARAEYLGGVAGDFVTAELRAEILSGSLRLDGGNAAYPPVFLAAASSNSAPLPVGLQPGAANSGRTLVKVPTPGLALRPGGPPASDVTIDVASRNGRVVSAARWFGPSGPQLAVQSNLPAWFYLTRQGVTAPWFPAATDPRDPGFVVGRFAVTVYDLSGCLDINVAGAPPAAATNAWRRDSTAWLQMGAPLWTNAAQAGAFVQWRNGSADSASVSAYESYLKNFAIPRGFLQSLAGHRAVLSRRDLINASRTGLLAPAAPGQFTHRSRSRLAPSWAPSTDAAGFANHVGGGATTAIPYAASGTNAEATNPFTANVRFSGTFAVRHYDDVGRVVPLNETETSYSYVARPGDPLLTRRFSLARLAWITPTGPKSGISDQAIEDCFGLRWNNARWRWDYVAEKAPPGVRIKTLQEAADEGREPNFFELLAAGILRGSLGRDPGKGFSDYQDHGVYASNYDVYKSEPSLHILQIGANLIDQYDADSYPTAIYFEAFGGLPPIDERCINTVYGIENLPYLYGLLPISLADPVPTEATPGVLKFWLQPELWNPHAPPPAALPDYPASLRGYAYGRLTAYWRKRTGGTTEPTPTVGAQTDYDDGTGAQATPGRPGEFYFRNPNDASSPFFANPIMLKIDTASSGGALVVDTAQTPAENYFDAAKWSALPDDSSGPNKFVGFALAPSPGFDISPTNGSASRFMSPEPVVYFTLQYLGPDGRYHPYTFMGRLTANPDVEAKVYRVTDFAANGSRLAWEGRTDTRGWGPSRPDPRTDRFSVTSTWWGQGGRKSSTRNPSPNSLPFVAGSGNGDDFGVPSVRDEFFYTGYDPFAQPPPYDNKGLLVGLWAANDRSVTGATGQQTYYLDPDGVVRSGDGARANTATGDGSPQYHGSAAVSPASSLASPGSGSALRRRPVILNRPFQSVGELGHAHRDLPFKSLDLWSQDSADGALLDLFSLVDEPTLAAGRLRPDRSSAAVLETLLAGVRKNEAGTSVISSAEAAKLAGVVASNTVPFRDISDLATRLGEMVSGRGGGAAFTASSAAEAPWANKSQGEAPMRALASLSDTRGWNLLVDVIAQVGMLAPGATRLEDFIVQGEKRYWIHLALDRVTGEVVSQFAEPVYE